MSTLNNFFEILEAINLQMSYDFWLDFSKAEDTYDNRAAFYESQQILTNTILNMLQDHDMTAQNLPTNLDDLYKAAKEGDSFEMFTEALQDLISTFSSKQEKGTVLYNTMPEHEDSPFKVKASRLLN
jgi:hypothetical protein